MKRQVHNVTTGEITHVDLTAEEEAEVRKREDDQAKVQYKHNRVGSYPSIGDQLDLLYKDLVAGKVDATGEWAKAIKKVKDDNPKP